MEDQHLCYLTEGGPRDFGVGGSISSLGSSLDEDSERLLSEYQLARSRAEAEIQRARQTLQLPHKPTATYRCLLNLDAARSVTAILFQIFTRLFSLLCQGNFNP